MHAVHRSFPGGVPVQGLPDLTLLRSFLVVAEELSFRRAAERLALDQSALSRRIQKLEAALGYRLLERTSRDVALTRAGRDLQDSMEPLLEACARSVAAARRVAEGKTGRVRVAYMAFAATELMPQTVGRFKRLHPHVDLELRYMRTQAQKIALANDEIDVGYMIGPFETSDCRSVLLASEGLYLVAPKGHRLLQSHQVVPRDLLGEPLILGDRAEWGEYRWRLDEMFSREGVPLLPAIEASNTLAFIGLVAAGLGITIYPESLIGFLGRSVETRPILVSELRSRIVIAWRRSDRSRAVLNFLEVARSLPISF